MRAKNQTRALKIKRARGLVAFRFSFLVSGPEALRFVGRARARARARALSTRDFQFLNFFKGQLAKQ